MEQSTYKYSGVKLTAAIFKELLIEKFDGTLFSRQSAVKKISEYHVQRGGIIEQGRDLISVFKKATQDMQKQNVGLSNKGYGMWELHFAKKETTVIEDEDIEQSINYVVDETIGKGSLQYMCIILMYIMKWQN